MRRKDGSERRTANDDPPAVLVRQNAHIQRRRRLENLRVGKGRQADLLEGVVGVRDCRRRREVSLWGGKRPRELDREYGSFSLVLLLRGWGEIRAGRGRTELPHEDISVVVEVRNDDTHQSSDVAL
jgi:hypothetical protein